MTDDQHTPSGDELEPVDGVDLDAADDDEDLTALDLPAAPDVDIQLVKMPLSSIAELSNIRKTHGIESLALSMHANGQMQPIVVRPAPDDADHDRPYELIFGNRRLQAAQDLGWEEIRAEVRPVEDGERIMQMLVENYQREDLSAIEEAYTMLRLKDEQGWSQAKIARTLGITPSQVSTRLKLLTLANPEPPKPAPLPPAAVGEQDDGEPAEATTAAPGQLPPAAPGAAAPPTLAAAGDAWDAPEPQGPAAAGEQQEPEFHQRKRVDILALIDEGKISVSTAEVIVSLPDREQQEKVAGLAAKHQWKVKEVERYVRKMKSHEAVEGPEEMGPVEMVQMSDAVELSRIALRPDLSPVDIKRINILALLRNGMDQEMLDYLQNVMGYPRAHHWSYIAQLSDDQLDQLLELLLRRYISAAHRYYALPPEVHDTYALPADADAALEAQALESAKMALPGAIDG